MAATMSRWLRYAYWLLPQGVHVLRQRIMAKSATPGLVPRNVLAANASLKNRHEGQRCFILGNGPSAKLLDLASLQGETVFSVSNGYLHRGYSALAPAYHCVPQITYGRMTEDDVLAWFQEMHRGIGDAELFLNESEAALVRKHGLFSGRRVHYLAFRQSFDEMGERHIIDISQPVPRVESVPVMVLMIALYMGFEEILLLGIDHDHFKTGRYTYAFDPQVLKDKDFAVSSNGDIAISRYDDFQSLARLWRQYRVIREIAQKNARAIFNVNSSSELDEFPYKTLQHFLKNKNPHEAI
jgi:hypothetical protein